MQKSFFTLLCCMLLSPGLFAKAWQLRYGVENIRSDTNFLENGKTSALTGNNNLNAWVQDLQIRYRQSKALRYSMGFGFNYVSSFTSDYERTNLRLSDLRFGADYSFHKKWGKTSIGSEAKLSTFKVDETTDEALISSGASELTAFLRYHNSFWTRLGVLAQVGYTYRNQGLSNLGTAKLEAQLLSMPIVLALGVESIQSLTEDEFTNTPSKRTNVINQVNGGSYEFYSINPKKTNAYTWLSYSFTNKLLAQIGLKQTLSGSNTSKANQVFFALYYSFQESNYSNDDLGIQSYKVDEHGEFKIHVDEYEEEDLFLDRGDKPRKKVRTQKKKQPKKSSPTKTRRKKITDPEFEF